MKIQEILDLDSDLHDNAIVHGYFTTQTPIDDNGKKDNDEYDNEANSQTQDEQKKKRCYKLHYRKFLLPNHDNASSSDTPNQPKPFKPPKGICVFQHGIQGHGGKAAKYSNEENNYTDTGLLARKLASEGYILYSLDMLGHGLSEGIRFYIPRGQYEINRDHLSDFVHFASQDAVHEQSSPNGDPLPIYLFGESYGGNLALHVTKHYQLHPKLAPPKFQGLILIAPAIIAHSLPPPPVV